MLTEHLHPWAKPVPRHPEWLSKPVWAPVLPVSKLGLLGMQYLEKLKGNFYATRQASLSTSSSSSGTCVDPESLSLDVQMSLLVSADSQPVSIWNK